MIATVLITGASTGIGRATAEHSANGTLLLAIRRIIPQWSFEAIVRLALLR